MIETKGEAKRDENIPLEQVQVPTKVSESAEVSMRDNQEETIVVEGMDDGHEKEERLEESSPAVEAALKKPAKRWFEVQSDSWRFGIRFSLGYGIASLFVVGTPYGESVVPEASFIIFTVGLLLWFPSLSGAQTLAKAYERIIGTAFGCSLGLAIGFISIALPTAVATQSFLFATVFVFSFLMAFLYKEFALPKKYPYAASIAVITFPFVALTFWSGAEPVWQTGVFRVVNIVIGSIIAASMSIFVFPRPAGYAARQAIDKAILSLSTYLTTISMQCKSEERIPSLETVLECQVEDKMHQQGTLSSVKINELAAHIPLLKWSAYELYQCTYSRNVAKLQVKKLCIISARLRRIHNTACLVESIIRNAPEQIKILNQQKLAHACAILELSASILLEGGAAIRDGAEDQLTKKKVGLLRVQLQLFNQESSLADDALDTEQHRSLDESLLGPGAGNMLFPLIESLAVRAIRFDVGLMLDNDK